MSDEIDSGMKGVDWTAYMYMSSYPYSLPGVVSSRAFQKVQDSQERAPCDDFYLGG